MTKKYFRFDKLNSPIGLVLVLFILMAIPVTVYTVLKSEESSRNPQAAPIAGFTETTVVDGISQAVAMEFAPDGRIFVLEQTGLIRVVKIGAVPPLLPAPFYQIDVGGLNRERGMLGIAFDPNYATNRYVYFFHTVPGTPPKNRVSRITANATNPDVADTASRITILDLDGLSNTIHNGGAIHFGNDGKLYVAVGDDGITSNAQNLSTRHGKILRINSDGTIPTDNPTSFTTSSGPGSTSGLNSAIYAIGFRNPFTFDVNKVTGKIYINDVGDNPPVRFEEINELVSGANYGWGAGCQGTICSDSRYKNPVYSYDPGANGGCAITGGVFYNPTTVKYPSDYVGDYLFADYCGNWIRRIDPTSPSSYQGFATGVTQPVDLKVSNDGDLYYLARVGSGAGVGRISKIVYGSETHTEPAPGSTNIWCEGESASPLTPPMAIARDTSVNQDYIFTTANDTTSTSVPITTGSAEYNFDVPTTGIYTFTARMNYPDSSSNSYWLQFDNDPAINKFGNDNNFGMWHWVNFTEGDASPVIVRVNLTAGVHKLKIYGREPNAKIDRWVLSTDSLFTPQDSNRGPAANCAVSSNQFPTATIITPSSASYIHGQTINFSGTGSDPEDGTLPASAFTWTIDFRHDVHPHPHQIIPNSKSGSFVADYPERADNVFYRITLSVVDSGGKSFSTFEDVQPIKTTNTIASSPTGLQVKVDDLTRTTPTIYVGVVGFPRIIEAVSPQSLTGKNYQFTSWSNGGSKVQTINTPATNTTYTATFSEIPSTLPAPWLTSDIGIVGLVGSASHSSGTFTVAGSGTDVWDTADAFRYVYQNLAGNGSITARINSQTNTDPWAKAGIMIREDFMAGSTHAFMLVTPGNGLAFQYRTITTSGSFSSETIGTVPTWVRLQRAGSTFTAFNSSDGVTWTERGSTTISMTSSVKIGMAVTAHNNTALSTATFTNVTVTTTTPVPGDANGDGSVGVADLNILINSWASTTDLRADFNADRKIGIGDLTVLINNWGR